MCRGEEEGGRERGEGEDGEGRRERMREREEGGRREEGRGEVGEDRRERGGVKGRKKKWGRESKRKVGGRVTSSYVHVCSFAKQITQHLRLSVIRRVMNGIPSVAQLGINIKSTL